MLLAAGVTLILAGLTSSARAEQQVMATSPKPEPLPAAAPHGTNLRGTDGSETSSSVLSFSCAYVLEGEHRLANYHKLTCRFATTGIARPTPEQVAQRLRSIEVSDPANAAPDDFPAVCKSVGAAGAPADAPHRAYRDKLAKACAEKDVVAGKEAVRFGVAELWAKTCEAFNYGVREYEFQKIDDWTWRAMDPAAAGGAATIRTIWRRKEANELTSWSYKQVTSGDPACIPAPFGECAKDSTTEWTSDAPIVLTGCQFFN
jgi:hypothetical protein